MGLHQPVSAYPVSTYPDGLMDSDLAYASLQHLTVPRVVNYLAYIFGAGEDEILVPGESPWQKRVTTPISLVSDILTGVLACRIPVTFWGGPPDEEDWYGGSLLTLLIDRLFYNVAAGNDNIVSRFLEGVNGSAT